jgi:hypothetical protein
VKHYLLSVDPGKRKAGAALWCVEGTTAELLAATTVRVSPRDGAAGALEMALAIWRWALGEVRDCSDIHLAIEEMQADGRTSGAVISDILHLNMVVGAVAAQVGLPERVSAYTPFAWKRNLPKDVARKRVESRLLEVERGRLPKRMSHDAWDAVCIGAAHFKLSNFPRWKRQTGRQETT